MGGICALFGGVAIAVIGFAKFSSPDSYLWATAYAVRYLPYIAPDITRLITEAPNPTWDVEMNATIAVLDLIEQFVDIALAGEKAGLLLTWSLASPWIEEMLNVLWEVPVIVELIDNQSTPTVIGFLGNTIFNVAGITSSNRLSNCKH